MHGPSNKNWDLKIYLGHIGTALMGLVKLEESVANGCHRSMLPTDGFSFYACANSYIFYKCSKSVCSFVHDMNERSIPTKC